MAEFRAPFALATRLRRTSAEISAAPSRSTGAAAFCVARFQGHRACRSRPARLKRDLSFSSRFALYLSEQGEIDNLADRNFADIFLHPPDKIKMNFELLLTYNTVVVQRLDDRLIRTFGNIGVHFPFFLNDSDRAL